MLLTERRRGSGFLPLFSGGDGRKKGRKLGKAVKFGL